jgi:hypothetical protein
LDFHDLQGSRQVSPNEFDIRRQVDIQLENVVEGPKTYILHKDDTVYVNTFYWTPATGDRRQKAFFQYSDDQWSQMNSTQVIDLMVQWVKQEVEAVNA